MHNSDLLKEYLIEIRGNASIQMAFEKLVCTVSALFTAAKTVFKIC